MCRSGVEGGRRCPGEHDPVKIAARNKKRMERYYAKKAVKANSTVSKDSSMSTVDTSDVTTVVNQNNTPGREKLGIHRDKQTLPEMTEASCDPTGFYTKETIRGTINYKKLGIDSYKEFGFSDPYENQYYNQAAESSVLISLNEMKDVDESENYTIKSFTGHEYIWINSIIYGSKKFKNTEPIAPFVVQTYFDSQPNYFDDKFRSPQFLQLFTQHLDSALKKGPKKQRIVYRGIDEESFDGDSASHWLDKNRSIGQEVVFDGYTSASYSRDVCSQFSGSEGVIYEILTPEGMAIAAGSEQSNENEVLLPRNQRYMVVGVHKDVRLTQLDPYDVSGEYFTNVVQLVAINSKGEILDGTNADPIEPIAVD